MTRANEHPTTEFVPLILGGDIGAYALGREFHEAYGVTSLCLIPEPIGAIKHSRIFRHVPIASLAERDVIAAVEGVKHENPGKKLLLITNSEACIPAALAVCQALPEVVSPMPAADVIERVSRKDQFAELCRSHGLDTPETEVVDLAGSECIPPTALPFPVVAKPAFSPEYAGYMGRGFKKVYFVQAQSELDALWQDLRAAGFAGKFLVQELVEGDDTFMDSVTLYIDSTGTPTLFGAAHVLLEDHAPSMLGNPVAMITTPMHEIWERCAHMLCDAGWRGYANFDIKRSPRDGRSLFLEVNPRIGRNSYYNCAAGVNPMRMCVEDLIYGRRLEASYVTDEILYTLVPLKLLRHYVRDNALRDRVEKLIRADKVFDPQRYARDRGPRRMIDVLMTEMNQVRKFKRYYPEPTDTSF